MWSESPEQFNLVTPKDILVEQAEYFNQMMRGLLVAKVKVDFEDDIFYVRLNIKAPTLSNYNFNLLVLFYSLDIYPCTAVNELTDEQFEISNEAELRKALQEIFNAPDTVRAIAVIRSQAA